MKYLFRLVLACLAMAVTTGCVESLNGSDFKLTCSIDKSLNTSEVSLFLLEQEYNRVYNVATAKLDSATGNFIFEGQIESPCVAFLKFDNDSTAFFFVLEQGESSISIAPGRVMVQAGEGNHEYFNYLKHRNALLASRREVRNRYLKAAAPDSLIKLDVEKKFLAQDSVLADSLERVTLAAINRNTLASRIILDKYVNELRPQYLKKVVHGR